jgi:hypothetical protein
MLALGHAPPCRTGMHRCGGPIAASSAVVCSRIEGPKQLIHGHFSKSFTCHATQQPQHTSTTSTVQSDLQQRPPRPQQQPAISRRAVLSSSAAACLTATVPYAAAAAVADDSMTSTGSSTAVSTLPQVPKAQLAPGLSCSRVIKGCWQLSGGHVGESQTNRTSGQAAVEVSRGWGAHLGALRTQFNK